MRWKIRIPTKVGKKITALPKAAQSALLLLLRDLEEHGPATGGSWKNYGKFKGLRGDKRHCHLSKGRPTYVCCWEVIDKEIRLLEVYYVGTHEKAPY
ncbi:TPA: hypothetical protein U2K06_002807 [Legionella pneumophila]|nr:hypothetical protein [Legionella pneumophila]